MIVKEYDLLNSLASQEEAIELMWKANYCFIPGSTRILTNDDFAVIKTFCNNNQLTWEFPDVTKNMSKRELLHFHSMKALELMKEINS